MMAVGNTFGAKEKVEEDRYIRAREQELARARAQATAAEMKQRELEQKSAELVAQKGAFMKEAADLLATTGDVVSEAGLANLADWKVGK
ncbi:hypothetical protein ACHAWU_002279 [Discostella pseudostelligera]|uniref:Uncharacterized protein n=1 Tax=Discostella pseudostelligera TaxID=259834 RepID=A0ABD3MMU2_9STRA